MRAKPLYAIKIVRRPAIAYIHDSWLLCYVLCCSWHCSRVFAMLTESDSFMWVRRGGSFKLNMHTPLLNTIL